MEMENLHLAISGIIGAGKTTLAEKLGREFGLRVGYEPQVDTNMLTSFYEDKKSNSFMFEVHLLTERLVQQQQLMWSGSGSIQDRTIYEDTIFAKSLCDAGMMRECDYNCYMKLFGVVSQFMMKPDLIIHLDVSPQVALGRVNARGRICEASITIEYLEALLSHYDDFISDISRHVRVIRINWDIEDMDQKQELIIDAIRLAYNDMRSVRVISV
jgi:deoxyadenosine/deoxycytidine kinase